MEVPWHMKGAHDRISSRRTAGHVVENTEERWFHSAQKLVPSEVSHQDS